MIIAYGCPSLKDARKAAGFKTSKEFAEMAGIPPTTYCRYEQKPGHIPMTTAMKLADVLDITLDEVVGRKCYASRLLGPQQAMYNSLSPRGKAEVDRFLAFQAWSDGNTFKEGES